MDEIIDTHCHVISTDTARFPLDPIGGRQSKWSQERQLPHEKLIAAMDEAGVAKAVVVQASTVYGHDNSYLAEAVTAHPDRITGVFSVDMLSPDAVDRMKHWCARGLTGARVFTTGTTMPGQAGWLDDERSYPAWRFAEEENLPVCVQMTPDGVPALRTILNRFPGLPVILDHFARPELSDGPPYSAAAPLFALAEYPNVYVKLTHRSSEASRQGRSTPTAFLSRLVTAFGAERIIWGSNYPAQPHPLPQIVGDARAELESLSQEDRAWVFSRTAKRLFPALADASVKELSHE